MSNLVCVPLKDAKLPCVDHFIWMLQQTQIWLCEEHSNFLIKSTTEIQAQKILFIEYGMEPRNLFLTKFYRIKNLSNSDILFLLENKAIKSFLHKQNTSSGRKGSWRVLQNANAVFLAWHGCYTHQLTAAALLLCPRSSHLRFEHVWRRAPETPSLGEELLATAGCWERERHFLL